MFFKRGFRPAFACASYGDKSEKMGKSFDGISFDSSETDDFNSFSSSTQSKGHSPRKSNQSQRPSSPHRKTVTLEIPGRTVAIAVGVVVGIILLVVFGAILLTSGTSDIVYEDNAFAAYKTIDGTYRVAMNGKEIDDIFESEVELSPAKNNAFAYVTATVADSQNVYILDNGKLKLLCEAVDSVYALADYEPGVVCRRGDKVEYFYDETSTSLSRNSDKLPENFVISPDGTAIAYTIANKNDTSIKDLYVYTTEQAGPESKSAGKVSTIPVAISNEGEYVIAYTENGESRDLYLIEDTDRYKINDVEGAFNAITCTNASGDSVVFTTKSGSEYRTYIYDCTKMKKDFNSAYQISNGYAVPQYIEHDIVAPESFGKCYYQDVTGSLTIYVNKKYEAIKVSDYLGKIDPDGRFLYIINEQRENTLIQVELLGERFGKDDNKASSIATDVKDFVITNKGNLYYTDGYGDLYFFKLSKEKPSRITNDVTELNFYTYSNDLYFEKMDSVDTNGIYLTSEGSDHKAVKLAKTEITDSPVFTHPHSKRSYACYLDSVTGNYILFYTANGSSFKQVAECEEITSEHRTDLELAVADVLS